MKIEVWSDFVCPFCYIGKRRLEVALAQFHHGVSVKVEYKSYQLDEKSEANNKKKYHELLAAKYGMSFEKVEETLDNMSLQAAEVGLTYNFDTMQTTNTLDAHRIVKYANAQGKGNEMTERLLKAYFTDSEHIGDHETLSKLAKEVGLDKDAVIEFLESCKYTAIVRDDQEQASEIGVQGVPFYVFNEKYALSGAQPTEAFSEVLEKIWEEENENPVIKSLNTESRETTYCSDESCDKTN